MHASRTIRAQLRFRDQRSYRQLQNFVWTYSYSRDSRGPSCSLGQAQRPFPSSPLIPPTSPDAAGSRRSPCRPGLHLVDRVSRSRIRPGHVRNLDRRSNKKNREPDALREDPLQSQSFVGSGARFFTPCWQRIEAVICPAFDHGEASESGGEVWI